MTTTDATAAPRPRGLYARLWRDVPQELGFLLPTLFIVLAGTITLTVLLSVSGGLFAVVVGIALLVASLWVGRGFGAFELTRLRAAGRPAITPPPWGRAAAERSGILRFLSPIADGHAWLYLLHTLVVAPVVGIATWAITVGSLAVTIGGLTFWAWGAPSDDGYQLSSAALLLVLGAAFAALLPFVLRGLVVVHWGVARGMLGTFRSEQLAGEVRQLSEARAAAASAEGGALRRLERDLHDGPQQRLVRLQMDLSSAARALETDPERARTLLAEAEQQSREALEELRALSRGFAPPLLLDRGLRAALDALATRSAVPTRFVDELPADVEVPVEVERNLYFVAAEALTNAAKHADATAAEMRLGMRRVPAGDQTWVDLAIRDDGRGGADPAPGHGLAGLDERVRGMGGILEVSSPAGGPTVVSAHVPLVR